MRRPWMKSFTSPTQTGRAACRCAEPALTRDRALARIGTLQLTEKLRSKKKANCLAYLQCAFLLVMCASPRANHALRTVPLDVAGYAQAHDDAAWETLQASNLAQVSSTGSELGCRGPGPALLPNPDKLQLLNRRTL